MFIPTKEQLDELGFEKLPWIDVHWIKGNSNWYLITIKDGIADINWEKLHPQSIEDIKTLIRILYPNN